MEVIGVRFRSTKKIYYFSPNGLDIKKNDNVVVETARGIEFGQTVIGIRDVPEEDIIQPLQKVVRIATPEDEKNVANNLARQKDAFDKCLKKIEQHQLDMKLVDAEYTFDGTKLIFYFTSDGRVDFRELVKDLATLFRTRIELRQIAVRDETKMLGGLGACGNEICCKKFLGDFASVSIKMAKEQNLSLNPSKISGLCGRLICCLNYEKDFYDEMNQKLPLQDEFVMTPRGQAQVLSTYPLKESVRVKVTNPDGSTETTVYHINDITRIEENVIAANKDIGDENDDIDFIPDELAENTDEIAVKAKSKAKPYNRRQRENVTNNNAEAEQSVKNNDKPKHEVYQKRDSRQPRNRKFNEKVADGQSTVQPDIQNNDAPSSKDYKQHQPKPKKNKNTASSSENGNNEANVKSEALPKKPKHRHNKKTNTVNEQNNTNTPGEKNSEHNQRSKNGNFKRNKQKIQANNTEEQEKSK